MGRLTAKPLATTIFVLINVLLRFSESTKDFHVSRFRRFGSDISLTGHVIGSHSEITLLQCSWYCSENSVCVAINFESFSERCELLSSNSHEYPSDVVYSAGVSHYHLIVSKPTTSYPTDETTVNIHTTVGGIRAGTKRTTTNEAVRQTTTIPGGSFRMETTKLPTTRPTKEQTTEHTPKLTTELTTKQTTKQTTHTTEQTTRLTTEHTTELPTKQTTKLTTELATPMQTTSVSGCKNITTVTDFCEKTFSSECEKVATPNYPNKTRNDFSCGFSIQAPEGQEAQLFFEYFSFEDHPTCSYDHLAVYERLPVKNINFRSPRLCGSSANPLVTTDGFLYIMVNTDELVQSGGMFARLVFSTICGKTFSTNGEEIRSPFYPDPLPVGITEYVCQFQIVAPTGSTVRIEFSFLHMEVYEGCIYDRIEFYNEVDGNVPGELLTTVCGETLPTSPVYLNTNSVVVKVISDYAYTSNGFVFTYWFE